MPAVIRSYGEFLRVVDGAPPKRRGKRPVVGIAGPPASGKSALLARLVCDRPKFGAMPMDGFHLSNAQLKKNGALARKGAPDTFNAEAFKRALKKAGGWSSFAAPLFDRDRDRVIPRAQVVAAACPLVVVEGNYLLHEEGAWRGTSALFDFVFYLHAPLATIRRRLTARWRAQNLPEAEIRRKVCENDIVNAKTVMRGKRRADAVVYFAGGLKD